METELDLQYKNMGKIVVAFNRLDMQLNSFIGWMISEDLGMGQIITSQNHSVSKRLELLFVLFKYQASSMQWFGRRLDKSNFELRDQLVKELHKLKVRAIEINKIRNKVFHSFWFQQQRHLEEYGDDAPLTGLDIRAERSKKISGGKVGLKYEVIRFSSSNLEKFVDQIEVFINDLENLEDRTKELTKKNIGVS